MRVLAALDKFRGTLTAAEATAAIGAACWELSLDCDEVPMSDGGEGLLDVFGGGNRTTVVTGPLGSPVEAGWRIDRRTAVIEMARASGLALAGGADGNDPLAATTRGTGELIAKAIEQGARTVLVGLGGSATTDGGLGAIEGLGSPAPPAPDRPACRVRRAHPFRRCCCRVRTAKGRHARPGPAAPRPSGAIGRALPDRLRSRRPWGRRHWCRRRAGGRVAGRRCPVAARLRPRRRARRPRRTPRRRRRRRHRRGLPRRPEPRRQGCRRDLRSRRGCGCPRRRDRRRRRSRRRHGAPRPFWAPIPTNSQGLAPSIVVSLVEQFGEQRAFTEPRWCIEQAARQALATMR